MPHNTAIATVEAYYAAFNAGDMTTLLSLLDDRVIHDISQGGRDIGRDRFARFMDHMNHCYRERLDDLIVMANPAGTRAAAEFTVHGTYLNTDPGVPPGTAAATGQSYTLPAGAFFELRAGHITRVSNHYNLGDWVKQIT